MTLSFSAWPPGSIDAYRRLALGRAKPHGMLTFRDVAALTLRA